MIVILEKILFQQRNVPYADLCRPVHVYCTKGYFIRERRNVVSFNVVSLFLFSLLFASHASTIVDTAVTAYCSIDNGGNNGSEEASASKNPSVSPCLRLLLLMSRAYRSKNLCVGQWALYGCCSKTSHPI
jgi:hypothetical protein